MCHSSHDSSFVDEKKTPLYRLHDNVRCNPSTNHNFDFHAKSVDFTNNQNNFLGSYSLNNNTHLYNDNMKYNEYLLNRAFIQSNIGRNQQNTFFPYNYTIDPLMYNPQIYKFNDIQNPKFTNNNFRSEDSDVKMIIDHIYLYIRDQNGCRILQKKIEEKNHEFLSKFYEKVCNYDLIRLKII